MFVFTAKIRPKKAVLCLCLLGVLLVFLILLVGRKTSFSPAPAAKMIFLPSEEAQNEYLTSLGWEVEGSPLETKTFRIPEKFTASYETYNALQLQQGFDLTEYRGKEVCRVTYRITNHPSGENVVADLLLCEGTLIGGDVQSPALGGFMEGLSYPESARQTLTFPENSAETVVQTEAVGEPA